MIRVLLSTTLALAISVSLRGSGVCSTEESPALGTGTVIQEMRYRCSAYSAHQWSLGRTVTSARLEKDRCPPKDPVG